MAQPKITVILPTYRRPALLRRAVESVLAQTYPHWNLLVGDDDEDTSGPAWRYLLAVSRDDARVTVRKNPAPHGQTFNTNALLRLADGEWIKPLHDDDVLRPTCLAVFAAAVRGRDSVALASCGIAEYVSGRLRSTGVVPGKPRLAVVPQRYVHLGMYLQDDIGAGVPTQMMARRSAIEQGALFEKPEGIWSAVDSLWAMRVLQHGDSLHINAALCERHQGEHESITNMIDQSALDREFEILRSMQLPMIDPSLRPPSLSVVTQMLKLIRAATRVKNRRPLAALGLACQAWHPAAWRLALEWYCRRGGLAGTSRIPRYALDDAPIAALLRDTLPPTATAASPRPAVRPAPVSLSPDLGLPASA